jgi:hypothetical protein
MRLGRLNNPTDGAAHATRGVRSLVRRINPGILDNTLLLLDDTTIEGIRSSHARQE